MEHHPRLPAVVTFEDRLASLTVKRMEIPKMSDVVDGPAFVLSQCLHRVGGVVRWWGRASSTG